MRWDESDGSSNLSMRWSLGRTSRDPRGKANSNKRGDYADDGTKQSNHNGGGEQSSPLFSLRSRVGNHSHGTLEPHGRFSLTFWTRDWLVRNSGISCTSRKVVDNTNLIATFGILALNDSLLLHKEYYI